MSRISVLIFVIVIDGVGQQDIIRVVTSADVSALDVLMPNYRPWQPADEAIPTITMHETLLIKM